MKALRRELALALVILVALSPLVVPSPSDGANAPVSWTIMLYMAGDATPELPWEDNINAMEAAAQGLGTSIVALVDPLGEGNSRLLRIQQDMNGVDPTIVSTPIDDGHSVIPESGEVNMAAPSTLNQFLDFSVSSYPSARTMLVLWGHGAGWAGICPDGGDFLTLPELRTGLQGIGPGNMLDMIAVDACAAASFEMLYEVRGYTDYFIAAENNVPFQGLPYTRILEDLAADTSVTIPELGSRIVSDYIQSAWRTSPYSTTMAFFDMGMFEGVLDRLSDLSRTGMIYDDIFHATLNDAVNDAEDYDIPYYFDFGHFMRTLQERELPLELRTRAIEAERAYRGMILAFEKFDNLDPVDGIRVANATGAVIFAPSTSFADALYATLGLASTEWYDFGTAARTVRSTLEREHGPDLTYTDSPSDNDDLSDSVTLTWPGVYDQYSLWVFRQETGGYVLCGTTTSVTPSITISGFIGDMLISAAAISGGEARTSDSLNITLYGTLVVTVVVVKDGEAAASDYDLRVVLKGTNWSYAAEDGSATLNLSVPSQTEVGDLMLVEVMSPGSEKVLGSARSLVYTHNFTVIVEIFSSEKETPGTYVMLMFSMLPGALILVFALMLYRDGRRQKTS